jgi:glycosyltransferase involved in cell wall biosynthesis
VNEYGQRRAAGVAALNAASLVLCPSRVLLDIHASMGVETDRLRHVPLGLPHIDAMRSAATASAFADRVPWNASEASRPLRMAYYGSTKPNKGLATLVRAITSLPASVLSRCHFDLFAPGDAAEVSAMRAKIESHTSAQVRWFGAYEPRDLAASVGTYEVGLLPNMGLENSPLVLLEYLAAGAWVIASDLGASREWVRPGHNGTLFPAGDCAALPPVRSVHASVPFVSTAAYVADVEARHEEVLAGVPA